MDTKEETVIAGSTTYVTSTYSLAIPINQLWQRVDTIDP